MKSLLNSIRYGSSKDVRFYQDSFFVPNDHKPKAVIQISPAIQPNGVFVNYGDAMMYWPTKKELEQRGYRVIPLFREIQSLENLKNQPISLFIDLAGFIYSQSHNKSIRSAEAAKITAHNAQFFKERGALTITAPQTFGPYRNHPDDRLNVAMKIMFEQMDRLYVRDPLSAEYLNSIHPDTQSLSIKVVPDTAFLYKPKSLEKGLRLLSKKGLNTKEKRNPIVGLVINRQIYDRDPSYIDLMKGIIRFFKSKNAQVVLIPHEHGRYGRKEKDDQFLSNLLSKEEEIATLSVNKLWKFPSRKEIEYIGAIEAAICSLDFLVSGRFHGALRGLSEAIPTLALSWSHKYETLFQSLDLSPEENILTTLKNLTLSSENSQEQNIVLHKLEKAWANRHFTKQHLMRVIPSTKQKVSDFFDEVTNLAEKVAS